MDAVSKVVDVWWGTKFHGTGERWCVLITLDVRNAFNTASWSGILGQLELRGVSSALRRSVRAYFEGRSISLSKDEHHDLSAGIPQGSVLGPLLWNVFYDPVLRLDLGRGVETVGFADDLAIIVSAQTANELIESGNSALSTVEEWMIANRLCLAPAKTEAVVLSGRRDRRNISFRLGDVRVIPAKSVKYLGILIGENFYFGKHIKAAAMKAGARANAIMRLMPNIDGPCTWERRMLYGVVQSTILYGAPIWHRMMGAAKHRGILQSIQRRALLRVACAYRTVSSAAIQVVCGVPPIDLIVAERREQYEQKRGLRIEGTTSAKARICVRCLSHVNVVLS